MTDTPLLGIAQVATSEGLIQRKDTRFGPVTEVAWCPALDYRRSQPVSVVTLDHDDDDVIGETLAYERSGRLGLVAAMLIRADNADLLADGPWYLSPMLRTVPLDPTHWERGEVLQLSIVRRPGNTQTTKLHFAPLNAAITPRGFPWDWQDFWDRSKEQAQRSRYRVAPKSIDIVDLDELDLFDLARTDPAAARRKLTDMRAQNLKYQRLAPAVRSEPVRTAASRFAEDGKVYRHSIPGSFLAPSVAD